MRFGMRQSRFHRSLPKWAIVLLAIASSALWSQELGLPEETSEPAPPAFSGSELRTRPILLEEALKALVVEIEVHRWGKTEATTQRFSLAIASQPEFVENLELGKTSVSFGQDDWVEDLQLRFDIKDPEEGEAELQEDEIVLVVTSEDASVQPKERRFVIPLRYTPEVPLDTDGRSVLATTLREDFTGTVSVEESHLECVDEELTLFTTDPVFLFFRGFPVEERFYAKITDPDGEEMGTFPYIPGEDFGSGVLAAMDGAISPMYKAFDEYEHEGGYDLPMKAGVYTVEVAYPQMEFDQVTGQMSFYGDFVEIGTFELMKPRLYRKGTIVRRSPKPTSGTGATTRINASGGGSSASVEAQWERTVNGETRTMGATGSVSIDLPDELVWDRESLSFAGSVRVSNTTFGQEGERQKGEFAIAFQNGFKIRRNVEELLDKESPTAASRHRFLSAPMGESNTSSSVRDRSSTPTHLKFELKSPTFHGKYGYPFRLMGWHLRDPSAHWALVQSVQLRNAIGASGGAEIYVIYGPDPEGVAALPPEPEDEMRDPEEVASNEPEEPDEADPDANAEGTETLADGGSEPSRPGGPSVSTTGGRGGSGIGPAPAGGRGGVSRDGSQGRAGPIASNPVPARSQGGTPEQNEQLEEALASDDPNRLPPDHPRVMAAVAEWIGLAEPPANADPEVDLRYTEWGTLVGKAKGGIITQNAKPDEARGLESTEYLWGFRRGLDSLNHCQLEEWVMATLKGELLTDCGNRFTNTGPIAVPDVVGMSIDDAEAEIADAGLVPIIEIGPPANRPDDEGTISAQDPPLGSRISSGDPVAIEIFTLYIGSAAVPDLEGLTIDEAERVLEDLGFSADLALGDPAPTTGMENRIQKQDPVADARLESEGSVTLWVYDAFDESLVEPEPVAPEIVVPDLLGVALADAEAALERAGLSMNLSMGPSARSASEENQVMRQMPEAGTSVESDAVVDVWIYSVYIAPTLVPDLSNQDVVAARSQLEAIAVDLDAISGEAAPSRALSGKIYRQAPDPGVEIDEAGKVEVVYYSDYIEPVVIPNLVGMQANEAELLALENGLILRTLSGPSAPSRELAFTVASQSPAAGSEAEILDAIEVTVYEQPVSDSTRTPEASTGGESELEPPPAATPPASNPGLFAPPKPTPVENETPSAGAAITVPPSVAGIRLWTGSLGERNGIANPLVAERTSRPADGWAYLANDKDPIRAVSVLYGKPGEEGSIVFACYWEEAGDVRSDEIVCGGPYETGFFWDDEDWTMGRMNSASKRATAFFIAPTPKANACKAQLASFLRQAEQFARSCP